jgi:hypothetical protein
MNRILLVALLMLAGCAKAPDRTAELQREVDSYKSMLKRSMEQTDKAIAVAKVWRAKYEGLVGNPRVRGVGVESLETAKGSTITRCTINNWLTSWPARADGACHMEDYKQ